jgi:hypothetical protein
LKGGLGGHHVYERSQEAPILTASAMYILVVSAANAVENKKYQAIIRFLVSLQAIAPRAVVQIVLTKTDLVPDPEERARRAKWVLNVVNGYIEQLSTIRGGSHGLLEIEQDVICTSVKDASQGNFLSKLLTKILPSTTLNLSGLPFITDGLQGDTRKRVVDKIAALTLERNPPKLPIVGQEIQLPWFYFQLFVSSVREVGIDNQEAFAKIFAQMLKYHQQQQREEVPDEEDDDQKKGESDVAAGGGGAVSLLRWSIPAFNNLLPGCFLPRLPWKKKVLFKKTSSGMLQKDKEHMSRKRKRRDS